MKFRSDLESLPKFNQKNSLVDGKIEFDQRFFTSGYAQFQLMISDVRKQIQINEGIFIKYCLALEKLNEHFYIFHAHANNSLPLIEVNGYKFPPLMELSFVRKDLVACAMPTIETFPVEGLDYPNKTDRPDIKDWYPIC